MSMQKLSNITGLLICLCMHACAHPCQRIITHYCLMMSCGVTNLDCYWFRKWLGTCSVPSHHLNQCWLMNNWTHRNKLQWNLNQNTFFFQENVFKNVCKVVAILLMWYSISSLFGYWTALHGQFKVWCIHLRVFFILFLIYMFNVYVYISWYLYFPYIMLIYIYIYFNFLCGSVSVSLQSTQVIANGWTSVIHLF